MLLLRHHRYFVGEDMGNGRSYARSLTAFQIASFGKMEEKRERMDQEWDRR